MRKREREREQLLADLIPNQSPRKVVGGTYYTQVYVSGKETRKRARILDKSGLIGLIFPSLVRRILLKDRRIIETFDPIIISLLSPFDLIPRTIRSIVASFSIGLSNCSNSRGKSFSTAKRTRWGIDNSNSGKLSAAFARLFFPAYCAWHNKNCIRFFRTKLFPRILHKMKIANWITTRFDTGSPCFTRNRHLIIDFSGEDRTQARRKGNWKEGRIKYASRHQSNNRAHRFIAPRLENIHASTCYETRNSTFWKRSCLDCAGFQVSWKFGGRPNDRRPAVPASTLFIGLKRTSPPEDADNERSVTSLPFLLPLRVYYVNLFLFQEEGIRV